MALLLKPGTEPAEVWVQLFKEQMPDLEVRVWPEIGDPADIEFAMMRAPPPGMLATMPNLRWIASIPAGLDHIWKDPHLPDKPIVRCTYGFRADEMGEYVLFQALRFHRSMPGYEEMMAKGQWGKLPQPKIDDRPVGVMGLGELGSGVARKLKAAGFPVSGWTRTPRTLEGIETFHGPDGLTPFLRKSSILACVLPLTEATRNILDAKLFAQLPKGAFVINVARGEHLVDADLIAALDSGQLAGAALDVLRVEPPPPDHPLLHHPKVHVTPHISTFGRAAYMMEGLLENIRRARAGEPLIAQVDRAAGY